MWLNEKEEIEVTRDWSSRHLNVPTMEEFYKVHKSVVLSHVFQLHVL